MNPSEGARFPGVVVVVDVVVVVTTVVVVVPLTRSDAADAAVVFPAAGRAVTCARRRWPASGRGRGSRRGRVPGGVPRGDGRPRAMAGFGEPDAVRLPGGTGDVHAV